MKRKIVIAGLFVLPVMTLILHLGDFPFLVGAQYSDIAVSHFPNGLLIQQSLAQWKTIPLWSQLILSGYPFAANPLSGLFYLPGWLALAFPLRLGFNISLAAHLVWGGVGMYLLLRRSGLSEGAALFGALSFEAMPKIYSHLGAGHLTLVYAVTWTPWLLLADSLPTPYRRLHWVLPGLVLGTIALADIRWAPYAGLLWLVESMRQWWAVRKDQRVGREDGRLGILQWLSMRGSNLFLAVMVAAPLLLPLMEYTRLSTRSQMSAQDNLTLSMPPGQLFGLVYPPIGGAAEWMFYPGAVVLGLVIYSLAAPQARRKAGYWLVWIVATLLVSLGSFLPFLGALYRLPGMDLLRVPPRALFLTGFCFTITAAIGLQSLLDARAAQVETGKDRSGLALFGAAAFVTLFALAAILFVHQPLPRIQFAWGGVAFLVGAVLLLLGRARRLTSTSLTALLLAACLVDLIGVSGLSLDFRPAEQVLSTGNAVAAYLKEQAGARLFRIYSPSYSIPQQVAAMNGLELADGVDPLQLDAYARFMAGATGVTSQGYSVTMPPFETGDPAVDNRSAHPDAAKLGLLNVAYIASEFPLDEPGLRPLTRIGSTYVYENLRWLPRAWVQPESSPLGTEIQSRPVVETRPGWIAVDTEGPGLLVLSEIAYPGWLAMVDGRPAAVTTAGGLLRGVSLDPGRHSVEFTYRPVTLIAGLGLAGLAWLILLVLRPWRSGNG